MRQRGTQPFSSVAAPKSRKIQFRGATFKLTVSDDPDNAGHIIVLLEVDKPPRGLDRELHRLHMKPPGDGE